MFSSSPDKRAYQQEWQQRGDHVSGVSRPANDPLTAGANTRRKFGESRLLHGRVVDGVAYAQCYRVAFEGGHPPMPCVLSAATSLLPVGARQVNSLVLGSMVWVIVHDQLSYGVIVAVEPSWMTDPTLALSDCVHMASRCGLRVDGIHNAILRLDNNGGVVDWSAGRPFDGTLAGEWGAITETGMRVIVDSSMAQIGAGEMTGVFAFYDDELLRIAGVNYQRFTSGGELEHLLDQGEIYIYDGETPYQWEQRGALDPGTDPFRDVSAQAAQISEPHYCPVEPLSDDQMPFHRTMRLGGYLGQGGRRMVLLPPEGGGLFKYSSEDATPAVFEEFTTLTGRRVTRSAKGIFLVKQPAIPGPKRTRRVEAPDGDNGDNYRFAGLAGGGEEHRVAGQVEAGGESPQLQALAGVMDTVAYACNWEGVHAIHYHRLDWHLPEEGETPAGRNQGEVDYSALADKFYLPEPETVDQRVDHRYGDVPYSISSSVIGMLDDGGIVIRGGNGESITLAGGHITLSAPGDIWLKSGRNVNTWAGYDVILRAKHAADVSATEGAVRIKAETDVQVLAGNGGEAGAVLIESKAPGSYDYADKTGDDVQAGGIQLKSAAGDVVAWADNIYLRTGGGDVGEGIITLDAAGGKQAIYSHSSDVIRYLGNVAADYFGTNGNVTAANFFSAASNYIAAGIVAGDYCEITKGGLSVRGNVEIDQGHVFSQLARQYQFLVPEITGKPLVDLEKSIQDGIDAAKKLVKDGKDGWKATFAQFWYGKGRPGEDATIEAAGFSFRGKDSYRTDDFAICEDPWQQSARLAGGAPAFWEEKLVKAGSVDTYPYPGREKWKEEQTYLQQDLNLFDAEAGTAKPRGSGAYDEPKFADQDKQVPDGKYAVII